MLSRVLIAGPLAVCAGCVPNLTSPLDSDGSDTDCAWVAPENTWPQAEPPCMQGEGFFEGDVAPDFRLADQFGDPVALWQFHGSVVLLDLSTIWCSPCQELGATAEDTYQDYKGEGFLYVTILSQDVQGNPPDNDDINAWVDQFALSSPVLNDADAAYTTAAVPDAVYPGLFVVGRDGKIAVRVPHPTDAEVRASIESAL